MAKYECEVCGCPIDDEYPPAECPTCKCPRFIELEEVPQYISDIKSISTDQAFVDAMVKLHDEDPIEYQVKMGQLQSSKVEQVKQESSVQSNVPHCPHCNSTNLSKISGMKKAAKVGMFGIFGAGDLGKTWKCNNCGSKF